MNNYKLKTDSPFYKVEKGQLKQAPGSIYLGKGETITGLDLYLFDKKGKKLVGHVIKVKENQYIPFENVQSESIASNVTGLDLEQPELDDSVSMMSGRYNPAPKKMYLYYSMAVPPYYSITGKEWNEEIAQKVFYSNMTGSGDVVEISTKELEAKYKKSGSKKPFKEWVKSSGKDTLNTLLNLANQIIIARSGQQEPSSQERSSDDTLPAAPKPASKKESKILGMHPVTFGVVSITALALIAIGVFVVGGRGKSA